MVENTLREPFDREGFVCVRGFLSTGEVDEVHRAVNRYIGEVVPSLEKEKVLYDRLEKGRVLKHLVDMHLADSFFHDFIRDSKTLGLAEELLGEKAVPQNVEFFYKAPGVGNPTPPHQDGYYFCLEPNHALTLWLALVDCDQENGSLNYVRGSHLGGIHNHGDSGVVGFSQGLQGVEWTEDEVERTALSAGDLLAHHSKTIHFAGANRSEHPRKALALVYFAASSKRDEHAWERYMASLRRQQTQTV